MRGAELQEEISRPDEAVHLPVIGLHRYWKDYPKAASTAIQESPMMGVCAKCVMLEHGGAYHRGQPVTG